MIELFVEELSKLDQEKWYQIYETAKVSVSAVSAVKIADDIIKKDLEKTADRVQTINFATQEQDGELLICDEDGEYFFDAVLMGDEEHVDGKRIHIDVLERWAEYINEHGLVGDVDHKAIRDLIKRGKDTAYIRTMMKSKLGIAKAVKAFIEGGELKIRTWVDKRYRNIMKKVRGLSLESLVEYDKNDPNLVVGGDIFGFTLNVNSEPAYANARVLTEV
jgi:zona occludens toxin (predicted ATPase)